jgi:lipopolysaccharide/colanic/teichoic acid biosynthesis glycosyltransferase
MSLSQNYVNSRTKRFFDLVICILILPISIKLIILIGILIKLTDGGDIFFRQNRVGKGGKIFTMYKLRTFSQGKRTWIGKLIRPLALDELPQIFNVLKGDMSIFGIRALEANDFEKVTHFDREYPDVFDHDFIHLWKHAYLSARPGGLYLAMAKARSIYYRGYGNVAGIRLKMSYDLEHLQTETLTGDLKILLIVLARMLRFK